MPKLTIDTRKVEVPEGSSLLAACRKLGIGVPTLCCRDGDDPFTSCMVCVVKDTASGRLVPSCSARAAEGMVIESETQEVHEARRVALELLLSDHLGDCDGPCHRICPAHMDIPLMIRQIAAGVLPDALVTVKKDIALPAVLGRICPAPCEKGCRRGEQDKPVSICLLKRYVADVDLAGGSPYLPPCKPRSGKKVAIVGAGPTGLAAAYYLSQEGHACRIFDGNKEPGGMLRYGVPKDKLPREVLTAEVNIVRKLGVEFQMSARVGDNVSMVELTDKYDAIVLAVGSDGAARAESFGVESGKRGIKVDSWTHRTSEDGLFAGGGAIGECRMAVRAVQDGKAIAASLHQFLAGHEIVGLPKRFNSVMGRLLEGEAEEFMKEIERLPRVSPGGGVVKGFSPAEAVKEVKRCMHCDCRKLESCRLRRFADHYGAKQQRYKGESRKEFRRAVQHARVIYEPGKCILCGLCVRITEGSAERLGLAFIGRGFDVRVGVPFDESMEKALQKVASECVEACPTGALAWKDSEDSSQ